MHTSGGVNVVRADFLRHSWWSLGRDEREVQYPCVEMSGE